MLRQCKTVCAVLVTTVLNTTPMWAQSPNQPPDTQAPASVAISGRVLDSSGAIIRGATITVRSSDDSAERTVSTGVDGLFVVRGLGAGSYQLQVAAPGFSLMNRGVVAPTANLDLVLQVAGGVEDVLVRGSLERTTTAGKLPISVRDAVQTVNIVPRAIIEERAVTTINEAIETAVGVQPIVGYGGMDSAAMISRGFSNDWVLRNGFRLFRFGVPVDPVIVERLEVLKGPAGLVAGQTDPGGTLNLVSKAPVLQPFLDVDSTVAAHGFFRNTLDVGGAIPGSGDRLLTRMTVAHETADSHRDTIEQGKLVVAPQMRWQIAPHTAASVEVNYYRNEFDFERGLPPSALSLQVPVSRVVKDPRLPRSRSTNWAVFQSLTHSLGQNWTVKQAIGAMFNDNRIQETYLGTPDDRGELDVFLDRSVEENHSVTIQGELQGSWRVAGSSQRTVVGLEHSRYLFGYDFFDADGTFGPVASTSLFNPRYDYALPARDTSVFGAEYGSRAVSAYVDHQATLSAHIKLLVGGRLDHVSGFNFDRISREDAYPDKTETHVSPRAGVVFTPARSSDVFLSYATSFKPNVSGADEDGNAFDAETGRQIEFGVRHEIIADRLRAQVAVFRIDKDNVVVYEPPAFSPGHTGTRRSNGVELEAAGTLMSGWTLTTGYAFVDATITADTNPDNVGARLFGVPRNQLHLWNTYELQHGALKGLALGYGVFFADERAADEPASVMLPAYTRHDVMARYGRGRLRGQLNIENLTDARIYDTHGFFIYPRDGMAVRASVAVGF